MEISKQGEASKVDMISNLPDDILHLILSGIPSTEEVIRTSIFSTRWRYLWTSIPFVDIDSSRGLNPHKEFNKNKFEEFVTRVLANKSVYLDSFRINCVYNCNMSTVGQWIDASVRRNVKLLHLSCPEKNYEDFELPLCLVTCSSLEVLRLTSINSYVSFPKVTGFPALRVLELKAIQLFQDNFLLGFLKSCPLLEDLSLIDSLVYHQDIFCISCPKLKKLRINNQQFQKFVSFDVEWVGLRLQICCPKLEFLEFAGFMANEFIFESLDSLKIAVIHPLDNYEWVDNNVCELFAGFFNVESLSLHMCSIEKYLNLEDLVEGSLPNLKTLELTTAFNAINMVVLMRMLKCFPNLESLHLIINKSRYFWEGWNVDEAETQSILTCHLKKVEFLNLNTEKLLLDVACSFLEHGNELEEMVFRWDCDEAKFHARSRKIIKKVSKFQKASTVVKLLFLNETITTMVGRK